ncbi:c-type cytochrome [Sunxiuqinia elliptica]|uniref:Cytochrome C oxidase, cbb3-type, subunit III n=1 Tax=Sunxiuqinia elliptica TaxID=655355 RepID=A0A1I2HGC2_9BACT|nr:c-type cytochrome [Sunxiuqinia elliptica]SFF29305.1 Cytochrome C oxidase, cbb3-type, subunit III [Sunxiuqinia elliptica]
MEKHRNFLTLLAVVFIGGLLLSFVTVQDKKKGEAWDVPEKYQKMENPSKDDASLMKVGKILYIKHCRSCHGNKGEGDGPKAASLETAIESFTSDKFQGQSDGVIYYQSIIGRDEMPNYESKIPEEEDRWALVNYLRSMK